jgi:hypothetical protein
MPKLFIPRDMRPIQANNPSMRPLVPLGVALSCLPLWGWEAPSLHECQAHWGGRLLALMEGLEPGLLVGCEKLADLFATDEVAVSLYT